MSNVLLPVLRGLTFEMKSNSRFKTVTHTAASGKEARSSFIAYPLWVFVLNYDFLDDTPEGDADLETLHGFVLQRRGSFDSFLYEAPNANFVDKRFVGAGDGVRTDWQLKRSWGGFIEPVENPKSDIVIKIDGEIVSPSDYLVDATGMLSFTVAPPDASVISWSGGYYFRCRFDSDETDFTEFADRLYRHEEFKMLGSPVNKL